MPWSDHLYEKSLQQEIEQLSPVAVQVLGTLGEILWGRGLGRNRYQVYVSRHRWVLSDSRRTLLGSRWLPSRTKLSVEVVGSARFRISFEKVGLPVTPAPVFSNDLSERGLREGLVAICFELRNLNRDLLTDPAVDWQWFDNLLQASLLWNRPQPGEAQHRERRLGWRESFAGGLVTRGLAAAILIWLLAALPSWGATESEWEQLNQELADLESSGQFQRASYFAHKALDLAEKGGRPREIASSLFSLAEIYENLEQPDLAEPLHRQANELWSRYAYQPAALEHTARSGALASSTTESGRP